jgi:hypothetical protein
VEGTPFGRYRLVELLGQSVPAERRSLHYASRQKRHTRRITAITLSRCVAVRLLMQTVPALHTHRWTSAVTDLLIL